MKTYRDDFQQERRDREALHTKYINQEEGLQASRDQREKEYVELKQKYNEVERRCAELNQVEIHMQQRYDELNSRYSIIQNQFAGLQRELYQRDQQLMHLKAQIRENEGVLQNRGYRY